MPAGFTIRLPRDTIPLSSLNGATCVSIFSCRAADPARDQPNDIHSRVPLEVSWRQGRRVHPSAPRWKTMSRHGSPRVLYRRKAAPSPMATRWKPQVGGDRYSRTDDSLIRLGVTAAFQPCQPLVDRVGSSSDLEHHYSAFADDGSHFCRIPLRWRLGAPRCSCAASYGTLSSIGVSITGCRDSGTTFTGAGARRAVINRRGSSADRVDRLLAPAIAIGNR